MSGFVKGSSLSEPNNPSDEYMLDAVREIIQNGLSYRSDVLKHSYDEIDRIGSELAKMQAEREPVDNGDGTETKLLPVTYPKGLPVECVRVPRLGEVYLSDCGDVMETSANYTPEHPRLILRHAPKPPESVTWEAPLADGEWTATDKYVQNLRGSACFRWDMTARHIHGLSNPSTLGRYRFENGVGTLIEEAKQ